MCDAIEIFHDIENEPTIKNHDIINRILVSMMGVLE